ncbi:MAG: MotA/TolQ/ExbB proton channel family protein [Verrucomicrobiaceae bacterium]|nr:MAG: MotA/TolQ/ExbB proton channel family protein [Verrucomicrobiaceae bacterium]
MKTRSLARFSPLLVTALVLAAAGFAGAQEAAAAGGGAAPHSKSFFTVIKEGGWIMIPLFGFSVAMVWLIIDCSMRTGLKKLMPDEDLETLRDFFRSGDYVGAYQSTLERNSAFNNVARAGLINVGDGKAATEEGIVDAFAHEQSKVSTRISYLSVIGVCTPMVGLVGTVTGMIKAFDSLGAGNVAANTGTLAAAIGEVLIATASGLIVAIPAFMAFYFLRNRLIGNLAEVQSEIGNLFRKFPYHLAEGVHIGDQELYANSPNWVEGASTAAAGAPAL